MSVSFAEFKQHGLAALLADASADAGLNDDQISLTKRPGPALGRATQFIDNFITGKPVDRDETVQALTDLASVFAVISTAIDNAAARIEANPGTIANVTTPSGWTNHRTFS